VLAVTVAMCLLVAAIRRSGIGMQMLAVRSNERAAAAAGTDVRAVKLTAFAISAFIAGVAGTLYAYNFGSLSDARFDALTALSLIAFAYAGGVTLVSGALFAGLVSTEALLPHAFDKWLGISGNWFLLFGGVILIFTLIQHPEGIAGALNKRLRPRKGPKVPARAAPSLDAQRSTPSPAVER
jgi:branched-chain amino acid transport system permease protein